MLSLSRDLNCEFLINGSGLEEEVITELILKKRMHLASLTRKRFCNRCLCMIMLHLLGIVVYQIAFQSCLGHPSHDI